RHDPATEPMALLSVHRLGDQMPGRVEDTERAPAGGAGSPAVRHGLIVVPERETAEVPRRLLILRPEQPYLVRHTGHPASNAAPVVGPPSRRCTGRAARRRRQYTLSGVLTAVATGSLPGDSPPSQGPSPPTARPPRADAYR